MRRLLIVCLVLIGSVAQAQAPPSAQATLQLAQQAVDDAEKALAVAAPAAYKAFLSAVQARNAARALAEATKAKPETGSK